MTGDRVTSYSGNVAAQTIGPTGMIATRETDDVLTREELDPTIAIAFGASTIAYLSGHLQPAASAASRAAFDIPLWQQYLERRLGDFSREPRLDDYPKGDTLIYAWNVVVGLLPSDSPTPSVIPGDDGVVELIWEKHGWHLEIEIGQGATWIWAKDRSTGEAWSGDLTEHRAFVRDVLASMAR